MQGANGALTTRQRHQGPPSSPMDALILAAGRGTRLREGRAKCLVDLGGRPLVHHQLDALRSAGVGRFIVVAPAAGCGGRVTCYNKNNISPRAISAGTMPGR